RHTRFSRDWSSDVCSSDLVATVEEAGVVNQCGLVLRRSPAFRWVHHLLAQPEAGSVQNLVFRDDQYLPVQGQYASTWRSDVAKRSEERRVGKGESKGGATD